MEMALLIDITEKPFKIPLNQAVIEYIRRFCTSTLERSRAPNTELRRWRIFG